VHTKPSLLSQRDHVVGAGYEEAQRTARGQQEAGTRDIREKTLISLQKKRSKSFI